jgi:hypothetical protein
MHPLSIRLHGVVLSKLTTGTTLLFTLTFNRIINMAVQGIKFGTINLETRAKRCEAFQTSIPGPQVNSAYEKLKLLSIKQYS